MRKSNRTGDTGTSMVFAVLIMFAIAILGLAGLSTARSGLTLANNYQTSAQAEQAAESGLVHAITVLNTYGVVKFTDFTSNGNSGWNTLFGSSAQQFPGFSGISYTVVPATSPAATATTMSLISTGSAPGQSTRTMTTQLSLSQPYTCGAIDLPGSGVAATFRGTSFSIDGNDYTIGGSRTSNPSTLGISTRTQSDANSILSSLSAGQQADVTGTPVTGQVASVSYCNGPSPSRILNEIVPAMVSQSNSLVNTNPATRINGISQAGTRNNPRITYFTGDVTVTATGNATGYGIMIVDGSLTISGNFTFTGLVIVTGSTQITQDADTDLEGSATVYGALWSSDLSVKVGGNAGIRYSLEALEFANSLNGASQLTQPLLPQRIAVQGWSQG